MTPWGGLRAQAQRRLPQIAEAVEARLTVMAVGWLWAYALTAGGEPAVSAMLAALKREIRVALGPAGCRDLSRLTLEMLCELSAERSAQV